MAAWTATKTQPTCYRWEKPDGVVVRAFQTTQDDLAVWDFWVQKGEAMRYAFTVDMEGAEPENDPEFEECAQAACEQTLPALAAMLDAAPAGQ